MAAVLALCALLVAACASLSPIWNYSFRSYSFSVSPFSLLPSHGFGRLCGRRGNTTVPGSCEHQYVFKLYVDTVVFYAWFAALVVGGTWCCRPTA